MSLGFSIEPAMTYGSGCLCGTVSVIIGIMCSTLELGLHDLQKFHPFYVYR